MSRNSYCLAFSLFAVSVAPLTGCASRVAPFDQLDQAQVTILRLQAQPAQVTPPVAGGPLIPGLPPEMQPLAQQAIEQLRNFQKQSGIQIPGLTLPGMGPQPGQPQMMPYPNDPQWMIADQRPVVDPQLKTQLLDLFGNDASFTEQVGNCWYPGMVVSFQSPSHAQPIDVVISLNCNQVAGYGFTWPHRGRGLATESRQTLSGIYQSLFGAIPPQA